MDSTVAADESAMKKFVMEENKDTGKTVYPLIPSKRGIISIIEHT